MSGVDACVGLLEIPVSYVLKEKQSKHEFDGNIVFVGSVSFCFVYFQMTPTANRRHHTRNLVHGKLAVDETFIHSNKNTHEIVESSIHYCNKRGPQQSTHFFGWGSW
jgi:hypothetical protein